MTFDLYLIFLAILFCVTLAAVALSDVAQQKRVLFQHTYNKNLECRQALKGEIIKKVNEICGPVPQIKDFTGGN